MTAMSSIQDRTMECRRCGKVISADSRFCRHCGAETARPAARPAAASPAEPARDARHADRDVHRDPNHEQAVWRGRPAWRAFGGSWILWAFVSIAGLVASYQYVGAASPLVTVVWLFVGGAAAALLVRDAMRIYGQSYHLTSQRLFVHRGILTRVTDQLELLRVDDVRLRQGVLDRIVDTGDLDIFGTDETDAVVTLESIPAPAVVAEDLRRHVRAIRDKGSLAIERI